MERGRYNERTVDLSLSVITVTSYRRKIWLLYLYRYLLVLAHRPPDRFKNYHSRCELTSLKRGVFHSTPRIRRQLVDGITSLFVVLFYIAF